MSRHKNTWILHPKKPHLFFFFTISLFSIGAYCQSPTDVDRILQQNRQILQQQQQRLDDERRKREAEGERAIIGW